MPPTRNGWSDWGMPEQDNLQWKLTLPLQPLLETWKAGGTDNEPGYQP